MSICARFNLHLEQIDVKTIFLHREKKKFMCSYQKVFQKKWERELGLQVNQIFLRFQIDTKVFPQEI